MQGCLIKYLFTKSHCNVTCSYFTNKLLDLILSLLIAKTNHLKNTLTSPLILDNEETLQIKIITIALNLSVVHVH